MDLTKITKEGKTFAVWIKHSFITQIMPRSDGKPGSVVGVGIGDHFRTFYCLEAPDHIREMMDEEKREDKEKAEDMELTLATTLART